MRNNRIYHLFKNKILGRRIPGILGKVRNDDLFLVSYPKSGNTWFRFIIGNLISNKNIDFTNFDDVIPDPYQSSKEYLDLYKSPRIIKSHEPFVKKYPKVIYIYRDPRDVVISYYFWNKKYVNRFNISMEKYLISFIDGDNSRYDPWDRHVESWINSPLMDSNNILVMKYEDMKTNGEKEVHKIADFMDLEVSKSDIISALKKSSFNRMSELEDKQQNESAYLMGSEKSIKFVRSGGNDWQEYFTPKIKSKFKERYGNMLIKLGYEKNINW